MSGVAGAIDEEDDAAFEARRKDANTLKMALAASDNFGNEALQDYVLAVATKLTSEHHATLLASVKPGSLDCGSTALSIIEEFIVPKTGHTSQELDYAYNMIKNGMVQSDDVYEYYQKLLQAHIVKTHVAMYFDVTLTDSSKPCMLDYITMLTRVYGSDSAIISQLENNNAQATIQRLVTQAPAMTDDEAVRSFQSWLNEFQQKRVTTHNALKSDVKPHGGKQHEGGGHLRKPLEQFCPWCYANKKDKDGNGKRFPHTVQECISKKRAEAANATAAAGATAVARMCDICDESDHDFKACPFLQPVKKRVQEAKAAQATAGTTSSDASTGNDKVSIYPLALILSPTSRKRCWRNYPPVAQACFCLPPDHCRIEDSEFKIPRLRVSSSSFSCNNGRERPPSPDRDTPVRSAFKKRRDSLLTSLDTLVYDDLLSSVDEHLVNNALFSTFNKAPSPCILPLPLPSPPPTRGEIDSGATSCMTYDFTLIKDPVKCDVEIKMVDGKTTPNDVYVGMLNAQTQQDRVAKPWPEASQYLSMGVKD